MGDILLRGKQNWLWALVLCCAAIVGSVTTGSYSLSSVVLLLLAAAVVFICFYSLDCCIGVFLLSCTMNAMGFEVGNFNGRPENFILLLSFIALFVHGMRKQSVKLILPKETWLLILYICYTIIVSRLNSPVWSFSLSGILQLSLSMLSFVFITQLEGVKKNIYSLINWYVALGVLQTIYALIGYAYYTATGSFMFGDMGSGLMSGQLGTSVSLKGTFFEANLFSSFVGCSFLMTIALMTIRRDKLPYHIGCIVLLLTGITLGWTRSVWLGLIFCLLILFLYFGRKLLTPKTVIGGLLVILIFVPIFFYVQSLFNEASGVDNLFASKFDFFQTDGGSGSFRIENIAMTMNDWHLNPILGRGYFSMKAMGAGTWIISSPLAILHDTGIIGSFIMLILVTFVVVDTIVAISKSKDQKHRAYLIGMFAGFILNLIATTFTTAHTLSMFWVHMGLLVVLNRMGTVKEKQSKPHAVLTETH